MPGADAVRLNERPVNVARVAEITGNSKGYVYNLVMQGKIPYHKNGSRGGKGAVRFYESEVNAWMRDGWTFVDSQGGLHEAADKILEGV